jgi:hypothetical protein
MLLCIAKKFDVEKLSELTEGVRLQISDKTIELQGLEDSIEFFEK